MLPHVLSVFERIHALQTELAKSEKQLDKLHHAAPGNGGARKGAELVGLSEAIARLTAALEEKGIFVKDIDNGLVDFPHLRDNEEVFLCWRIGEKTVAYWHDLESGFRGRQPL
ncbi:MAG: DUF2203 domain-containing protein [candidate division Zixibacteria bacterium]|nr:DUF2203 domain-containing protein [candidate division Zixibacteria bacterium]